MLCQCISPSVTSRAPRMPFFDGHFARRKECLDMAEGRCLHLYFEMQTKRCLVLFQASYICLSTGSSHHRRDSISFAVIVCGYLLYRSFCHMCHLPHFVVCVLATNTSNRLNNAIDSCASLVGTIRRAVSCFIPQREGGGFPDVLRYGEWMTER